MYHPPSNFIVLTFTYVLDCDRGYSRDSAANECALCRIGTYSDTVNATSCTSCPQGYITSQEGSNRDVQCTGKETVLDFLIELKKEW